MNLRPSGYAYHFGFRRSAATALADLWSGLSLPPKTPGGPAIKSLHLPTKRLAGLARDYRANGFPDFDRLTHKNHFLCCPLQKRTSATASLRFFEPDELPGCSTPRSHYSLIDGVISTADLKGGNGSDRITDRL